jgi:gliding motility-associated-like protein
MRKRFTLLTALILTLLGITTQVEAQTTLVYSEDFENGPGSFILNTSSVGTPSGPNQWVVNNQYSGEGIYPNTTSQSNTVGGSINFAPFSNYLHIHDSIAAAQLNVFNANFNPSEASDRFVETGNFCTLGLDSVRIAFYFLCEGSSNASAQLYFQADNGPWTALPGAVFNNTNLWNYAEIYNPAFNNRNDIRFGFRWTNTDNSGPSSISMAIDGVRIVGVYSPNLYNIRLELESITPNPVCKGDGVLLFFDNPVPLCGNGFYEIQLSDLFGNFTNYSSLGIYQLDNEDTSMALFSLPTPSNLNAGDCYQIRVVRVDITPAIISDTSICISIIDCPNQVFTLQPAVLSNPADTVCVGSVIDVPFYSEGVFVNNTYVAQLSDSNGLFPPNPNVLGFVNDNTTYPVGSIPRGNVPGLIRAQNQPIPPGCNYYIRVIATSPSTIGSVYGPFCIRECDIETNNKEDVQFCITDVEGGDTTLTVEIEQFDPPATYIEPNEFQIQLLDFQTFGVINTGVVGSVQAVNDTLVELSIPPLPQLFTVGLIPGNYYMRIVATNSNQPWDLSGTLVRLTIGAPNPSPLGIGIVDQSTFIPVQWDNDTTICLNDALYFYLFPFNFQSQYTWALNTDPNFFEGGPYNPILFNSAGNYTLTVTETNFGCVGPGSSQAQITVRTGPSALITGPGQICEGDTATYTVPLNQNTYYAWGSNTGSIVDTLGNQGQFYFPSSGTTSITIFAVNDCGTASSSKNIFVREPPTLDLGADTSFCNEAELQLSSPTGPNFTYTWNINGESVSTAPQYTLNTDSTVTVLLRTTNFGSLECESFDTLTVFIETPGPASFDTISICEGDFAQLQADTIADAYLWSTGDILPAIAVSDTGWYTLQRVYNSELCPKIDSFYVTIKQCFQPLVLVNVFSPNGDGQNDFWIAKQTYSYEEFSMVIYNRWGQLVYESIDPFFAWNGNDLNGNALPDGTYFYVARLKDLENTDEQKGTVTLIR